MYQIIFNIDIEGFDSLSEKLFGLGALSISREVKKEGVSITALFESVDPVAREFTKELYTIHELDENEWKYSWLKYLEPAVINEEIYIHPVTAESKPDISYKYTIQIDPRDAFGDGNHPTTFLCLNFIYDSLFSLNTEEKSKFTVLDIGTGTGILSILCEMMGVKSIDAIDNEKASIERSKINLKLNNSKTINLIQSDIASFKSQNRYNIIIANLLTGILTTAMPRIKELLNNNGVAIISGISDDGVSDIKEALKKSGLTIQKSMMKDGWNGFVVTRTE